MKQPEPWSICYDATNGVYKIYDASWKFVFRMKDDRTDAREQCERIVQAVNDHTVLREAVTDLLGEQTDTYCDFCGQHAPKDDYGLLTGPIPHNPTNCAAERARAALREARWR